ncbi:small conductance mechanosensitive channel [Hydrogenispora ethanolica]|uniref:Small conductance mechanosensitive channel n=1 Tax=Hydrogenispora ethanolica TaxID=1082276 RepID=A0A4R1RXY2_HYDET|nr:mechanosensitive ion channel family protein [Hydrogenispora ethanolica]TCL71625.1 small conductance mechanosensitive channel [Hydrogenispora ethanolica]
MKELLLWIARIAQRINLDDLLYRLIQIVLVIVAAKFVLTLSNKLIGRVFRTKQLQGRLEERRSQTMEALLKSVCRYLIYFVAIVTVLQLLNVPVGSVLTTAGIAGVAVAFGAQSLVRDVITGFFILLEDQFQVGDRVTIADVTGKVVEIGLRVTKVRDFGGQLHIIPNGKIERVTNYNDSPMLALVDIPVAYDNNLQQVAAEIQAGLADFNRSHPELVEPATFVGVQALADTAVILRVVARTVPDGQWQVERELRILIAERFRDAGIKLPLSRWT